MAISILHQITILGKYAYPRDGQSRVCFYDHHVSLWKYHWLQCPCPVSSYCFLAGDFCQPWPGALDWSRLIRCT